MTVKQISWIFLHHDVNCIEQAIQASLFDKRCAEIRHNEITDEHHAVIRKMDEKPIACSSNLNFCVAVDGCIGFETANVFQIETVPEEDLAETTGSVEHGRELFAVV